MAQQGDLIFIDDSLLTGYLEQGLIDRTCWNEVNKLLWNRRDFQSRVKSIRERLIDVGCTGLDTYFGLGKTPEDRSKFYQISSVDGCPKELHLEADRLLVDLVDKGLCAGTKFWSKFIKRLIYYGVSSYEETDFFEFPEDQFIVVRGGERQKAHRHILHDGRLFIEVRPDSTLSDMRQIFSDSSFKQIREKSSKEQPIRDMSIYREVALYLDENRVLREQDWLSRFDGSVARLSKARQRAREHGFII